MSVVKQTVTEPAREVEKTTAVVCELCQRRGRAEDYPGGGDYASGLYEVLDVNVCLADGKHYGSSGNVETTILDICPDCFRDKLVPWFEAQGGKVRVKDVSF